AADALILPRHVAVTMTLSVGGFMGALSRLYITMSSQYVWTRLERYLAPLLKGEGANQWLSTKRTAPTGRRTARDRRGAADGRERGTHKCQHIAYRLLVR